MACAPARGGLVRGQNSPAGQNAPGSSMRLTLKLVLAFILANATLAGVYGYLSVRREVDRFRKQAEVKGRN